MDMVLTNYPSIDEGQIIHVSRSVSLTSVIFTKHKHPLNIVVVKEEILILDQVSSAIHSLKEDILFILCNNRGIKEK